jgi:hypothetical protein
LKTLLAMARARLIRKDEKFIRDISVGGNRSAGI